MARSAYLLIRTGPLITQHFATLHDLGRRLVALAEGDDLMLQDVGRVEGMNALRLTAVPLYGAPLLIGRVLRPHTADLRDRVALGIALAQSERAERRVRVAA